MSETREQLLMSRIIGAEDNEQEWREWENLAGGDPKLWRELAEAQRDQIALIHAVGSAGTIADHFIFPATMHHGGGANDRARGRIRLRTWSAWSGWAVAALVAIVASIRLTQLTALPTPAQGVPAHAANLMPVSARDAFRAYLNKGMETGEVVGEVPAKVLLDSRPAPTGKGYEVLYLRQVMERAIVPDLYQINGENELGQPTLARYQPAVRRSM
jgi:hypothetical protein